MNNYYQHFQFFVSIFFTYVRRNYWANPKIKSLKYTSLNKISDLKKLVHYTWTHILPQIAITINIEKMGDNRSTEQ